MDKPFVAIKYKTANGNEIRVEVSTSVKKLLEQSDRQIQSQRRQDRRYLDCTQLTEEVLEKLLVVCEDAADLLERKESYRGLHIAIEALTEVQRQRLYLYFFEGMSYSQIAKLEGVNYRSVIDSIHQAIKKLGKLYHD